jgi:hypothetical protein
MPEPPALGDAGEADLVVGGDLPEPLAVGGAADEPGRLPDSTPSTSPAPIAASNCSHAGRVTVRSLAERQSRST